MQTTKAYRKESSVRGNGSAPGCIPKLLFSRPDSAPRIRRDGQERNREGFLHSAFMGKALRLREVAGVEAGSSPVNPLDGAASRQAPAIAAAGPLRVETT